MRLPWLQKDPNPIPLKPESKARRVHCPVCKWETYALGNGPWRCMVCKRGDMKALPPTEL